MLPTTCADEPPERQSAERRRAAPRSTPFLLSVKTVSASESGPNPYRMTAVVPVKSLTMAKTRLALPAEQRKALALAFALDTISALLDSPVVSGVVVVTSEPIVACRLPQRLVRVVPDNGAGLNSAVRSGIRSAMAWKPATGIVVVPADLPCLRADDVTLVLEEARTMQGAFVPDWSATGTTLLIYPPGRTVVARYGPGSAARHRALGLHPLPGAPVRARHDVDTVEDLRVAMVLGTGPETAAAVAAMDGRGGLDQHAQ